MISGRLITSEAGAVQSTRGELRLQMKPSAAAHGLVDGGWWPWSNDLAAEFPELVMTLSSLLGPVDRIGYNPDTWDTTARTQTVANRTVRLEGVHTMQANTVTVTGPDLPLMSLVVVPPGTPGGVARAVLRSAAGSDCIATARDILVSNGVLLGERHVSAVTRDIVIEPMP
jgi:uncharacterized protein DUF5994